MNTPQLTMYEAGIKFNQQHHHRPEANFDRACDEIYRYALRYFGANDDGYLTKVKNNDRTTDSVCIEFLKYQRFGNQHMYEFNFWVERADADV